MTKKVYFDVGANDGISMAHHLLDPEAIIYAFEPTPRMVEILKDRYGHNKNYHIIPKAVSDVEGTAEFYISGNADWGCSSLCHFQESEKLEETWPGRTDFRVTDKIEIDIIRLDTFMKELNEKGIQIDEIEYFHCDVQGKDLEALMSMGEYIRKIKAGVIEMPTSHDTKLYKNQRWLVNDAISYLQNNGFEIINIESNDAQRNEVNVYFQRI